MTSPITSHVLDTSTGKPAAGVRAVLELYQANQHWKTLADGITNLDGRIPNLLGDDVQLEVGIYRLTFHSGAYFALDAIETFYPTIPVLFEIKRPDEHYHIPLLLSPYGYSTYRGS